MSESNTAQATTPKYDLSYNLVNIIIPVTIDSSGGEVSLWGEEAEFAPFLLTVTKLVNSQSLYKTDTSEGLFEYIEASGDVLGPTTDNSQRDLLDSRVNTTSTGINMATFFSQEVHAAMTSTNLSNIGVPTYNTNISKIDASSVYAAYPLADQQYDSMGDFILSYIAFKVFGHPRATAPISNDYEIINRINNTQNITSTRWDEQTSTNPTGDIAVRLMQRIFELSRDQGEGREKLKSLTKQMMLQDPARFANVRNELEWKALQFYPGDKIVMNLLFRNFSFVIGGKYSSYKDGYTPTLPDDLFGTVSDTQFAVVFTLGNGTQQ
jgi:hypothetical protein